MSDELGRIAGAVCALARGMWDIVRAAHEHDVTAMRLNAAMRARLAETERALESARAEIGYRDAVDALNEHRALCMAWHPERCNECARLQATAKLADARRAAIDPQAEATDDDQSVSTLAG